MTKPEAFTRLDNWCRLTASLWQDTEASVVQACRNPKLLGEMSKALKVDPIVMMEWVLGRLAVERAGS